MCEYPEVVNTVKRKARKQHKCFECGKVVKKGEHYQYTSGIWNREPMSFKQCVNCGEIMAATSIAANQNNYEFPAYGELRDWFEGFVCCDYNGKDWLLGMAKLIKIKPEKLNLLLDV